MDDPKIRRTVAAAKAKVAALLTEMRTSARREPIARALCDQEAASKVMDEIEARLVTSDQKSLASDLVALGVNMLRSFMGLPPSSAFLCRVASGNLEEDTARVQMLQLLTARQKQLESGGARG